MTWLWDLSLTLGWAHDSGTPGSWLRHHNRRCPYPVRNNIADTVITSCMPVTFPSVVAVYWLLASN